MNSHVFLFIASFNIKFISIINMQGCGATESENSLKTTISIFTTQKINIETIVGDKKFEAVPKALRPVRV